MKEQTQDYVDTFIQEVFHTFEGQITEDVVMEWVRVAFTQGVRHGKSFTPGVPTEDGWYVCKIQYGDREGYDIAKVTNGYAQHDFPILSHAKLPEL